MDVEIHNCKMISYSQNCINIYDAGFFTIKNCIIESKKNAIDYNNILNVFNHSGTIINSNIVSDENCIKLFNNSNLSIINSTLKSNYKCATLYENRDAIDKMIGFAINYFNQFVKPKKQYRKANQNEKAALNELLETLNNFVDEKDPEIIQSEIYRIGKEHQFEQLREWFISIYEILLGQKDGPRFGSFILIYGVENTQKLIKDALDGKLL